GRGCVIAASPSATGNSLQSATTESSTRFEETPSSRRQVDEHRAVRRTSSHDEAGNEDVFPEVNLGHEVRHVSMTSVYGRGLTASYSRKSRMRGASVSVIDESINSENNRKTGTRTDLHVSMQR